MEETLKSNQSENERFQKDHREEHIKLDDRIKKVEKLVIEHKVGRKKTKSDIDE